MKNITIITLLLSTIISAKGNEATFTYFTYNGNDIRFEKIIDNENEYFNPILAGFYPDPSICKKGDTYYLVNSSFAFFPGVPIFESEDLVNWKQIGHVFDRKSQLDLEGAGVSRGIFAPDISYNTNNDTFYMITTLVDKGGNFFVKSKNPADGWSDPIWLPEIDGIDPSFLFDDDGKAYIVHNAPVNGTPMYDGERAIRLLGFDVENDKTIGEPIEIVRGGSHVRENPIWIEGPHLYHIGEYYYLMCAEGGTGEDHSEVIFRSKYPLGPWEESPLNPILTQRDGIPSERQDIVTSTGHADIIQDEDGNWWAVFLGCRPYEGNLYNTGRDTFLLPVTWKDGWPIILEKDLCVPTVVNKPNLKPGENYLTGNFQFTDNFEGPKLKQEWIYLREPADSLITFSEKGLKIIPGIGKLTETKPLSAIFRRQQHSNFSTQTQLDFSPTSDRDLAGMVLLQNENYNFIYGKTINDGKEVLTLIKNDGSENIINSAPIENTPVELKIEGNGKLYSFYYKTDEMDCWETLAENVDASNLSTDKSGGFIGAVIGLYATGQ